MKVDRMDLFEAVEKRRSIRKFKPNPVTREDLKKILEAGRLAPSGDNLQPWYFIIVKDSETKRALSTAANNQKFIANADVVIVALGDSGTESKIPYKLSTTNIFCKQDPMIAIEHMVLAATALGYGTCWIGAFNEEEVKTIPKIPENLVVVALLPVGVPDENPRTRPRKAFAQIFFKESYGIPLEL
jgi:nitroreductase